jgi:hypothetical protein
VQVTPAAPQFARVRPVQVAPVQQPPGQDTSSHTQAPARQRWPAAQAELPPHWQVPPGEQPSAWAGSQAWHTAPLVPHAESARTLQVEPEQHPPGQLLALHPLQAPPGQVCFAGQASHAAPALPQAPMLLPD